MIIANERELEDLLSRPNEADIEAVRQLGGDFLLLGVAGKMGPSLALRVKRAVTAAGTGSRVIGVSRFSSAYNRQLLEDQGIETVPADLLQEDQLASLPDAPNVIYLAAPISFVIAAPSTINLWALVFLLSSFYVNTMSWAGLSAILEQKHLSDLERLTSMEMPSGLIEGAETIFFYSLLFMLPNQVAILFSVMAVLVFFTVGQRLWWANRHLRPISPERTHPSAKVANLSLPSGN